jgi:serine/threonine protein phosphatase 1
MSHFATPSPAPLVRRFAANPTPAGRDLIVGDVHGCFAKLRAALDAVGFDPDAGDRLFSVGDLVDRGPESADVLWWLDQPWFAAVAGNHEEMAASFAAGLVPRDLYAANGGAWLIGATAAERLPFADAFAALPVAIELETAAGLVCLVHAECPRPTWADFRDALADGGPEAEHVGTMARWSRHRISTGDATAVPDVLAVVVGHTPVERPVALGNVVFIDTGAWLQGGLSPRAFTILDAATLDAACHPGPRAPVNPS